MKRLPRIVAAQRLQTLLLLTALVAVILGCILMSDLVQNFRSVVVSDANKSLATALSELRDAEKDWSTRQSGGRQSLKRDELDAALRLVSYEVLRSYPDVEGGYYFDDQPIGHSFPSYTEPGSGLKQPPIERDAVLACLADSRRKGDIGRRVFNDGRDLVVVSALVAPGRPLAVWGLKRYIDFNSSSHLVHQLVLAGLMLISLASIGAVLKLSFNLQRGFASIQSGLGHLRTDLDYRLADQNHELRAIVGAINEMAASRQKLEADLRREDRLRVMGRVVAGIAHEIRNPLNSIRLTMKVLERRLRKQNVADQEVALITAEIDRLDKLLNSLLVFRADEPGRLYRQPILPILERSMALVKPQVQDRGIVTDLNAPPELEAVVDGDHLQQAMMNLLLNAIDAAGRDGRIQVSAQQNNGHLEIDVTDSGPGLKADEQDRLFEAFYTTKSSGTGMGLAITRTLLEKMGATIQYVGSDPGARFRILLPIGAGHDG
ncbi:MAG TPA: ATP-binding protein [Bryobacteraceae bacterium]|nr:ATP-binding protein [Bryobacteraceae bacterium]